MLIKFFNVGQGDSIIFDWDFQNKKQIGIIDCCSYNNTIPTIEYLSKLGEYEIEFLLLSHPHKDHYSGYLKLLDYINQNGIKVKYFIHSMDIDPVYLKWTELEEENAKMLEEIFDCILHFHDKLRKINSIQRIHENWQIKLGDSFILKAYSPSDNEGREFTSKIDYYTKDHWTICSSAANYLSTALLLENIISNEKFLFTSDCLDYSFKRLLNSDLSFNYFQIPHHGSAKSLFKPFWQRDIILNPKIGIISAGLNMKYKLPDYDVVRFFNERGINIKSTNYVNGLKEYFDSWDRNTHKKTKLLDDFSEQLITAFEATADGIEVRI